MRLRFAIALFLICILLGLPACNRHKENSQEKNAALPVTPPSTPAVPVPDSNAAQSQTQAPPQTPTPPQPLIVAAGTAMTVRLTEELGSQLSQTGQNFAATVDKDILVDGQMAIPAGSNVAGSVVTARPFGKLAGEAILILRLTSVNVNNVDQAIVTSPRSFGARIKAKGKVHKFFGGLVKRAEGDEKEVVLAAQSAYTFTFKQALEIQ